MLRCPWTTQLRIGAWPRPWPTRIDRHRLALLAHRPVRRERIFRARHVDRMQGSDLLQARDLALDLADRQPARHMRERGCQQIGAREHRLAFREMRHGPRHGFRRR